MVPLSETVEPVELLRDAERAADRGVDRQLGEAGLKVRAARIVGRDEEAAFENDLCLARDVDAAVDFRIEKRPIERRREVFAIIGVGAANVGGQRMARPVGLHQQFRRDDIVRGSAAAWHVRWIGVVAGRKLDRREKQKRPAANADRRIRVAGGDRQRPLRHRAERQGVERRQPGRRRGCGRVRVELRRSRHDGARAGSRPPRDTLRTADC